MDERHQDARRKIRELEGLLARGGRADELFASASRAKTALDFRASDATIGLDEVDSKLVDALRATTRRALAAAANASHVGAALELAQWALDDRDEVAAKDAVRALGALAENEPTGRAHRLLGYLAYHGLGCRRDARASYEHHRKGASCGDADAMFELHVLLSQGIGTTPDPEQAWLWCTRAAEAGNARAMANLGAAYATGRGVPRDEARSVAWYEKAANAGHGRAAATLGVMHATGKGAPRDQARARQWLARADDLGFDWHPLAEALGVDVAALAGKKTPAAKRPAAKKKTAKKTAASKRTKKTAATSKKKAVPQRPKRSKMPSQPRAR